MNNPYNVLGKAALEDVLPVILQMIPVTGANSKTKIKAAVPFASDRSGKTERIMVKVSSLRLRTFALKGTKCSCCGLEATHFNIECAVANKNQWHLNLYAGDILFTHDHTLSRGMGGADAIENTTTMCYPCNFEKSKSEDPNHN